MQTKEKSNLTIDEALLDQTLDHILNSPDSEFVTYATEVLNLDPEHMAAANKAAAQQALDDFAMDEVLATSTVDLSKVKARPSAMVNTNTDSRSYIERFGETAKVLGYVFSKKLMDSLSNNSLQQRMAFKAKHNQDGKSRKKNRP